MLCVSARPREQNRSWNGLSGSGGWVTWTNSRAVVREAQEDDLYNRSRLPEVSRFARDTA